MRMALPWRLANVTRSSKSIKVSSDRSKIVLKPLSSLRIRLAMSRARSFSRCPVWRLMAPGSFPPWPASMITVSKPCGPGRWPQTSRPAEVRGSEKLEQDGIAAIKSRPMAGVQNRRVNLCMTSCVRKIGDGKHAMHDHLEESVCPVVRRINCREVLEAGIIKVTGDDWCERDFEKSPPSSSSPPVRCMAANREIRIL